MEDNNKRMEDFFKNRVNDFDDAGDRWDLPDQQVWEAASAQFPKHPQKQVINKKLVGALFLAFSLLIFGATIFHLNSKVEKLEEQLVKTQKDFTEISDKLEEQKITYLKTTQELANQNEITNHQIKKIERKATQRNQIISPKRYRDQQKKVQQLIQTNKNLLKSWKETITANINLANSSKEDKAKEEQTHTPRSLEIKMGHGIIEPIASLESMLFEDHTLPNSYQGEFFTFPIHKIKKKNQRFEIGVNYSAVTLDIPIANDFEKLESIKAVDKNYKLRSNAFGIHLAYAIQPNLFIKTGIRTYQATIDQTFSSGLVYDKDTEYINEAGNTVNDVLIRTHSIYNEVANRMSIETPTNIADGDLLVTDWYQNQALQFIQVPLGIEYYRGKNKLQWMLKGGVAWNKVFYGDETLKGVISYNKEILDVKLVEKQGDPKGNKQFVSGYVGTGLNYQFSKDWNARASLLFEKYFASAQKSLAKKDFDNVLEVGINYRF